MKKAIIRGLKNLFYFPFTALLLWVWFLPLNPFGWNAPDFSITKTGHFFIWIGFALLCTVFHLFIVDVLDETKSKEDVK